jgi:hypothetical protein
LVAAGATIPFVCGGGLQVVAARKPSTFEHRVPRKRVQRLLEHDPEKWKPVFRKDHAQTKS